MIMRGREFLPVARALSENSGDPASMRTAVSRVYYAAYLEIREAIRPFHGSVIIDGYSSHANVARLLGNCGVRDAKGFHDLLVDLHRQRQSADYDLTWAVAAAKLRLNIDASQMIIAFAEGLMAGSGRRALRDGLYRHLEATNQLGKNYPAA